jgi:trk system potassium uptake protein
MNFASLSFFRDLKNPTKKAFAVIGLGRFGRAVCQTLHELGYEVLGIDTDEKRVLQIVNDRVVDEAQTLDSTNPNALREAGIFDFDTVIVAIGNFVEESIITTLNLKEGGIKNVVAKASSDIHEKLLKKVGADYVVFPEHDAGCNLARSLTKPAILDRFDLDSNHSIVEILVPEKFDQKSIYELQLRTTYGLNIIALVYDGKFEINPSPQHKLVKGSMMVVIGSNEDINRLPI